VVDEGLNAQEITMGIVARMLDLHLLPHAENDGCREQILVRHGMVLVVEYWNERVEAFLMIPI
jgi:hypothetical protein